MEPTVQPSVVLLIIRVDIRKQLLYFSAKCRWSLFWIRSSSVSAASVYCKPELQPHIMQTRSRTTRQNNSSDWML